MIFENLFLMVCYALNLKFLRSKLHLKTNNYQFFNVRIFYNLESIMKFSMHQYFTGNQFVIPVFAQEVDKIQALKTLLLKEGLDKILWLGQGNKPEILQLEEGLDKIRSLGQGNKPEILQLEEELDKIPSSENGKGFEILLLEEGLDKIQWLEKQVV